MYNFLYHDIYNILWKLESALSRLITAITAQKQDKIANTIDNNDRRNSVEESSFKLKNNKQIINLKGHKSVSRIAGTAKAADSYKYNKNDFNNINHNLSSERVRSSSSENFLYGFVKNFVKIRQHDSDVSPRPRRPYQNDSSSRYYNKSDVTGQGRIIGDNNTRSVTSVGEGGGGRRQQQYNNNQSDYIYNSSPSYNRSNTPPDPIKGGGGYNKPQGGSLRPSSPYNQQNYNNRQQHFGNYNGQNNYYSSKYENGRQHGTNTNNGLSSGVEYSLENQNGNSGRGGYRNNNDLGRSGINRGGQQHIVTENRNSTNNLNNFEGGNRAANVNNSNLGQTQAAVNIDNSTRQTVIESVEKDNVNNATQPRRWVPPSLRPQHGLTQNDKNDAIFRKVRGILNKLTPEKFQELSDDLLQIDLNSTVVLNGVILLIFEKALDEPKYSSMYAQLCKRLSKEAPNFEDPPSPSTCTFLRLLINVCRDKFVSRTTSIFGIKSGISTSEIFFDRDLKDDEITTEEEEKRHVAKQRMLGNVKFIGELSKLQMLSENVLHKCIQSLLDKKQRPGATLQDWCEDMECLCQLIRTCGKNLDTEQGQKLMGQYFEIMDQRSKSHKYPPRIRFMLRDIIELRENNWVPRKVTATEGPVPIRQIRTDDDNIIRPPYINHRNRDMRHNDRDSDNWMNRFPLNLQPGFNDMFSNLTVNSSPIMSPGYNNNNNNRQHNQRNNQNNHHNNYNNNRFNKHNNNINSHNQYNNTHNNTGITGNGTGANNTNLYNNIMNNKDIAPRFKRTLIASGQDPVENLQMRPAANSLLFKANMNIKTPQMLPISTPPMLSSSGLAHTSNAISTLASRSEAGGVIITPVSSGNTNRSINSIINNDSNAQTPELNSLPVINSAQNSITLISHPSVINIKDGKESNLSVPITKHGSVEKQTSGGKIGKKDKGPNKEEFLKKVNTFLTENLILPNVDNDIKSMDEIVSAFVELKVPEKFMKDTCYILLNEILDKSEIQHGRMIELIQQLRKENKVQSHALLDGFKQIINKMSEKEATIPRVTTHVASLLSRAVTAKLCNISDIAAYTDGGQHYPLILLVLQQLHKNMSRDELEDLFAASKVDLILCLPEADRNKERLAEILEDRNLTFLYPLLKVQAEMLKQIQAEDNPQAFNKWIKSNVDSKYHSNPGFISSLMTVILKYISQVTILADGTDTKKYPEKTTIEKEEALLHKYCYILENFLNGKIDLQLIAIYALQVYCFNLDFPKGMLCRWFKNLYEANVIEEDAFFRWKEEISDEFPGKGMALFQVNNWLTWLEQAESEDED